MTDEPARTRPTPPLEGGRCIRFVEEGDDGDGEKKPFAVLIEVGSRKLLVARGTKNGKHHADRLVMSKPILPGSAAALRWHPPLEVPTYFYDFDIRPIRVDQVDQEDIAGMCDADLWDAILDAAREKAAKFKREWLRTQFRRR